MKTNKASKVTKATAPTVDPTIVPVDAGLLFRGIGGTVTFFDSTLKNGTLRLIFL